jgi:hypothetical protein
VTINWTHKPGIYADDWFGKTPVGEIAIRKTTFKSAPAQAWLITYPTGTTSRATDADTAKEDAEKWLRKEQEGRT